MGSNRRVSLHSWRLRGERGSRKWHKTTHTHIHKQSHTLRAWIPAGTITHLVMSLRVWVRGYVSPFCPSYCHMPVWALCAPCSTPCFIGLSFICCCVYLPSIWRAVFVWSDNSEEGVRGTTLSGYFAAEICNCLLRRTQSASKRILVFLSPLLPTSLSHLAPPPPSPPPFANASPLKHSLPLSPPLHSSPSWVLACNLATNPALRPLHH